MFSTSSCCPIRSICQGKKQTYLYLRYPLFEEQWDTSNQQNHQTQNYLVKENHLLLQKCLYQVRVITVFTVFRLLNDFVCLYNYEFGLSLCKIVRSSVILLLPLSTQWNVKLKDRSNFFSFFLRSPCMKSASYE